MSLENLQAKMEAILFASGEAVELSRIQDALEIDKEIAKQTAHALADRLEQDGSGIRLVFLEDKLQLCTRAEYAEVIRRVLEIRRNAPLSQAAMEVLAVIAYNQPVTRAFVEQVRGVDCSAVVSNLAAKGLIEEKGRLELPGRPLLYGTTADFLRSFGLDSLERLPAWSGPPKEDGETALDDLSDAEQDIQLAMDLETVFAGEESLLPGQGYR